MRLYRIFAAALALLVLAGCGGVVDTAQTMATITDDDGGTVVLTKSEFINNYQRFSSSGRSPQQVFQQMVAEKLGLAEAKQEGISVKAEEVDEIIANIEESSGQDLSTEEGFASFGEQYHFEDIQELRRYILDQLTIGKISLAKNGAGQVHARHILLGEGIDPEKSDTEQEEAFNNNKERADELYKELNNGADFEKLATEHSTDPGSGKNGGDLGLIKKGQTVPAFEEQLFALEEDEIGEPVKTQFGWHIIQRLESHADQQATASWLQGLYKTAEENDRIDVQIKPEEAAKEVAPPATTAPQNGGEGAPQPGGEGAPQPEGEGAPQSEGTPQTEEQ